MIDDNYLNPNNSRPETETGLRRRLAELEAELNFRSDVIDYAREGVRQVIEEILKNDQHRKPLIDDLVSAFATQLESSLLQNLGKRVSAWQVGATEDVTRATKDIRSQVKNELNTLSNEIIQKIESQNTLILNRSISDTRTAVINEFKSSNSIEFLIKGIADRFNQSIGKQICTDIKQFLDPKIHKGEPESSGTKEEIKIVTRRPLAKLSKMSVVCFAKATPVILLIICLSILWLERKSLKQLDNIQTSSYTDKPPPEFADREIKPTDDGTKMNPTITSDLQHIRIKQHITAITQRYLDIGSYFQKSITNQMKEQVNKIINDNFTEETIKRLEEFISKNSEGTWDMKAVHDLFLTQGPEITAKEFNPYTCAAQIMLTEALSQKQIENSQMEQDQLLIDGHPGTATSNALKNFLKQAGLDSQITIANNPNVIDFLLVVYLAARDLENAE